MGELNSPWGLDKTVSWTSHIVFLICVLQCAGACAFGTTVTMGAPLKAEIVPSSLEKMALALSLTTASVHPHQLDLLLKTSPVGLPCSPPAPGTIKSATIVLLATLYKVVVPVPLLAIHQGVVVRAVLL